MPETQSDVLARYFFDIADKLSDLSESEIAESMETFGEEDFGSLIATMLDAAYWVLAGDLDPELEGAAGPDFYVASNVYNDLLYRGYKPDWAWDESGLGNLVPQPTETKNSSAFGFGDHVSAKTPTGLKAGVAVASDKMYTFDGAMIPIPDGAERVSRDVAYKVLATCNDQIIAAWNKRIKDSKRGEALGEE
mgnify:CR=1 FL=1